jgi:hypothetical protein
MQFGGPLGIQRELEATHLMELDVIPNVVGKRLEYREAIACHVGQRLAGTQQGHKSGRLGAGL